MLFLGLRRVRLVRELASPRRFRLARVETLRRPVFAAVRSVRQRALRRELREALLQWLPGLPEAEEQLHQLLDDDVPLGVLTDVVGYMLDIDVAAKQSLLAEVNVYRRAESLLRHLWQTVVAPTAADAASLCFPPQFSSN